MKKNEPKRPTIEVDKGIFLRLQYLHNKVQSRIEEVEYRGLIDTLLGKRKEVKDETSDEEDS